MATARRYERAPRLVPAPSQTRSIRAKLGRFVDLAGVALALLWLVGRLVTDRSYVTQYVWWVPTLWMAAAVAAVGLLGLVAGLRARGGGWRVKALAAAACMTAWMLAAEWRLVMPADTSTPAWSALSWNATDAGEDTIRARLVELSPDLAAVVNAPWGANFRDLLPEFPVVIHSGAFLMASKHSVARWATADLLIPAMEHGVPYGGRAMFAEVVVAGAPRVVWVVDMPSDPRLSRKAMVVAARARLEQWTGPVYVRHDSGWRSEPLTTPGFPLPDVVMGDFNSPRGSASAAMLAAGLTDAFTQAGHGDPASWPRERPWWALDQVFLRPPLSAVRYDSIDPGEGDHRLVVVRVK